MKRPISRIFVANPPVLGEKRRKIFEKQFESWPKRPPPISYIGVNKNFLDLTAGSEYKDKIIDDRSRWARLKLRFGLEKRAENFRQKYDPILRQASWVAAPLQIGHVATTFSHIRIWEFCQGLPDDELCMIVEDDVLINPEIQFGGVEWPEAADLLHLWPGSISFYEEYSDDYVRVLQKWEGDYRCNSSTMGYIITPACARRFLSKLIPYIVNRTVDMEILYRGTPRIFAVKKPWITQLWSLSLITRPPKIYAPAAGILRRLQFLIPRFFRRRHPLLFEEHDHRHRFDEPRLG